MGCGVVVALAALFWAMQIALVVAKRAVWLDLAWHWVLSPIWLPTMVGLLLVAAQALILRRRQVGGRRRG